MSGNKGSYSLFLVSLQGSILNNVSGNPNICSSLKCSAKFKNIVTLHELAFALWENYWFPVQVGQKPTGTAAIHYQESYQVNIGLQYRENGT